MTIGEGLLVPPVADGPRTVIRVGGLHTLVADLSGFRPTHMIGILDPDVPEYPAALVDASDRERLLLRFHDRPHTEPGGPSSELVGTVLAFLDRTLAVGRDRPVRLFVHCHAGISRSTATAYLALIRQQGVDGAEAAFRDLLTIVNKPWPNRSIVALADDLLAARGRLLPRSMPTGRSIRVGSRLMAACIAGACAAIPNTQTGSTSRTGGELDGLLIGGRADCMTPMRTDLPRARSNVGDVPLRATRGCLHSAKRSTTKARSHRFPGSACWERCQYCLMSKDGIG
jgi:predicted protein tyrosine phosphatase